MKQYRYCNVWMQRMRAGTILQSLINLLLLTRETSLSQKRVGKEYSCSEWFWLPAYNLLKSYFCILHDPQVGNFHNVIPALLLLLCQTIFCRECLHAIRNVTHQNNVLRSVFFKSVCASGMKLQKIHKYRMCSSG